MAERPVVPPQRKPVSERLTPNFVNVFYSELVDRDDPAYHAIAPVKRGTLYSTVKGAKQSVIDAYPNLFFLKELKPGNSADFGNTDRFVIFLWATDPAAESTYNADVEYLGDAVANPAYTRVYTIRRDVFDAGTATLALGTALTALIGIKVTAGGSGYTSAPTVTITGGSGSGATAQAVLTAAGAVSHIIVTNEGTGYTTAPTIGFTGGAGTGAAATGLIQSQSAVLTSQKKTELPAGNTFEHHYVLVRRIYELLPGPWLPFTRYSDDLGPIQGRKRAVVNTSQTASLTSTVKTTYEARDGSSYVSWQIEETNSDGTGGAGNPAYPILIKDFYDDERGAVQQVSQIVVKTGSEVGSLTESGGTITRITYEPFNEFLLRKITETWTVAGPSLTVQSLGIENLVPPKYRRLATRLVTLQDVAATLAFPAALTGNQVFIEQAMVNIAVARKKIVTEVIDVSASPLAGAAMEDWGKVTIEESLVTEGTAISEGFNIIKSTVDPLGANLAIKINVQYAASYIVGLIQITNGGSGYTSAPTVGFTGGAGSGAAGTAIVSAGKIIGVYMTNNGTAYTSAPTVSFTSGGGTGAAATAYLAIGKKTGQEFNRKFGLPLPFNEYLVSANLVGFSNAEIRTGDYLRSVARVTDYSRINTILNSIVIPSIDSVNLDLPDVLNGFEVLYNKASGTGIGSESATGSGSGSGGTFFWNYNVSSNSSAHGSAAISPLVIPDISTYPGRNVPALRLAFFVIAPANPMDLPATILTRINTLLGVSVTAYPKFQPKPVSLALKGQKHSVEGKTNSSESESGSFNDDGGSSEASGSGSGSSISKDVSTSNVEKFISPTLHAEIIIADATDTQGGTTTGGSVTATASVEPDTIPATAITVIPTSGICYLGADSDVFELPWLMVSARVFNWADAV